MVDIFYPLTEMDSEKGNDINAVYSSNVIWQMGWVLEDRKDMTPKETVLQNHSITVFANKGFGYCLEKEKIQMKRQIGCALRNWRRIWKKSGPGS